MILCITEKPEVGRSIAKILGATIRRDGYIEGPEYCVSWTFGHLCCLKDPADYTPDWKSWSLSRIPMIPPRFGIKIMDDAGKQKQMKILESLIKRADKVINCGDAGQEGELIQRWVMQLCGCDKPVERLWVSSLTDEALREGFSKLRPHKDLETLYLAGLCRAIGDWLLGINATRLYTLRYSSDRQILSVGRVQTPTLALVVERQKEIENFVARDSWELRTVYRDTTFTANLPAFDTEDKGHPVMERLRNFEMFITGVERKKGKEGPPKLYDLTSLQVEANRKYSIGVDVTLKTVQSLYEKKLTTYPRVDTTYLTLDLYPKCGAILNGLTQYAPLLEPLRGKPLKKSKKVFDNSKVTDHHAIIPTGQPLPQGLTVTEQQIFDLIARRFIACFYPDLEYEQTSVMGMVDDVEFKTSGKRVISRGWKEVYAGESAQRADKDSKDESSEQLLVSFTKGEHGPHSPLLAKKTTQPPKYYTEGTLLRAMETAGAAVEEEELREALKANGIGRPSTRDAIIKTLYKRGYIVSERKSIRATEAGIALIGIIREELLKSAKLTGIWERKLREIERGEYSAEEFIEQLKKMIQKVTLSVLSDNSGSTINTTQYVNDNQKATTHAAKTGARKAASSKTSKQSKGAAPKPE